MAALLDAGERDARVIGEIRRGAVPHALRTTESPHVPTGVEPGFAGA